LNKKEKDQDPPSIEEVEKLFFGQDDSKPLNDLIPTKAQEKEKLKKEIDFSKDGEEDEEAEDNQVVDEDMYPEVEVNETKKPKKEVSDAEKTALRRQLRFLKTYEERKKKLLKIQEKVDEKSSEITEQRSKVTEKRRENKKEEIRGASYLTKYMNPVGRLYGKDGKIFVTECKHIDVYDGTSGVEVLTRCTKCSRVKTWGADEWQQAQKKV